jgi:hypothetical protein
MVSDTWWSSAMKKANADIVITRSQVKY